VNEQVLYTGFEVYNVNHYDVFRNPVQAKELLIQALDIQPIPNSVYDGEKDGRMVKLMPVNHIATKADVADLIHGVDYKAFEKRKEEKPNQPVEKITIFCMGHEPDLAAFVNNQLVTNLISKWLISYVIVLICNLSVTQRHYSKLKMAN
jgi:site-specific DNA-methyltransferase (adenine-specific)/adenine-specific DNA-methyltransferase